MVCETQFGRWKYIKSSNVWNPVRIVFSIFLPSTSICSATYLGKIMLQINICHHNHIVCDSFNFHIFQNRRYSSSINNLSISSLKLHCIWHAWNTIQQQNIGISSPFMSKMKLFKIYKMFLVVAIVPNSTVTDFLLIC